MNDLKIGDRVEVYDVFALSSRDNLYCWYKNYVIIEIDGDEYHVMKTSGKMAGRKYKYKLSCVRKDDETSRIFNVK
jgi:hypothetical protein